MKKRFMLGVMGLCLATATFAAPKAKKVKKEPVVQAPAEVAQSSASLHSRAVMYYTGKGTQQDFIKALYFYKKAADQGHLPSMIAIGHMHEMGEGVAQNYEVAMKWYQLAAKNGYASAQKAIGDLYRRGLGVAQNDEQAAMWYKKAAEQHFAGALCQLGYLYVRGRGVPRDLTQGRQLLEEGAAQNDGCSQHYLGYMYMKGLIGTLPDTKRALEYEKMAASNEDPEAEYNMGKANEIGWIPYASKLEATNWYRHSANHGYPLAMERLAELYELGQYGSEHSLEKSDYWKKRAKEAWKTWPEKRPESIENVRFMPE